LFGWLVVCLFVRDKCWLPHAVWGFFGHLLHVHASVVIGGSFAAGGLIV